MGDGSDKCGDSKHVSDISTSSETSRSSSFSSEASNSIQSKLKGGKNRNMLRIEGIHPTRDVIETKKCKKNQVTKCKIVRKKRKTKKHRKSRKGTERVPKQRA